VASHSKSAGLRPLGVRLPLPAPQIPEKLSSILGKAEMHHFWCKVCARFARGCWAKRRVSLDSRTTTEVAFEFRSVVLEPSIRNPNFRVADNPGAISFCLELEFHAKIAE